MPENTLYYGDNLEVMRKYLPDECIDLVYLDPPFNSNRDYNLLFREPSGCISPSLASTAKCCGGCLKTSNCWSF